MNEMMSLLERRRSIRKYQHTQVSREQVELLTRAGQLAPSGQNRQSRQITVLQDAQRIRQLAAAIAARIQTTGEYKFFGAPTLILLSDARDNHLGELDCACALENIFLMATSLNLGTCWVNQLRTLCDEPEVRALLTGLGIPEDHLVWGIATVGVPDQVREPRVKFCPVKIVE